MLADNLIIKHQEFNVRECVGIASADVDNRPVALGFGALPVAIGLRCRSRFHGEALERRLLHCN